MSEENVRIEPYYTNYMLRYILGQALEIPASEMIIIAPPDYTTIQEIIHSISEEETEIGIIYDKTNKRLRELGHGIINTRAFVLHYVQVNTEYDLGSLNTLFRSRDKLDEEFPDIESLEAQIQRFNEERIKELSIDEKEYNRISEYIDILSKNDKRLPARTDTVVKHNNIVFNVAPLNPNDCTEAFNSLNVNNLAPYIKYNDGVDYLYKIYTGDSDTKMPIFSNYIHDDVIKRDHTMRITLWMGGKKDREMYNSPADYFAIAIYNMIEGIIEISLKISENIDSIERATECLRSSGLNISGFKIVSYGVDLSIFYSRIFQSIYFADLVLKDELLSFFLYADERVNPLSMKKRFDLHYKNDVSDTSTVISIKEEAAPSQLFFTSNGKKASLDQGSVYIKVKVNGAKSLGTVDSLIHLFRILLRIYSKKMKELRKEYSIIESIDDILFQPPGTLTFDIDNNRTKVVDLRKRKGYDRIFGHEYARKVCQSNRQAVVLTTEKQAREFEEENDRETLKFPAPRDEGEVPSFWFGCLHDKYPYPSVKGRKHIPEGAFPYAPCCFERPKDSGAKGSDYLHYYLGEEKYRSTPVQGDNKIKTYKVIPIVGSSSYLPYDIERFLGYNFRRNNGNWWRYGVQQGPNSFLHAVLSIMGNRYEESKDKERYVLRYKKRIFRKTDPNLYAQELYDEVFNNESEYIKEFAQDDEEFFSDELWYRGVEEYFDVNIFIFTTPRKGVDIAFGDIGLPRYKSFHTRYKKDRKSILILRNYGSDADRLPYPHYETIGYETDKRINMIFDKISEFCYDGLLKSQMVFSLTNSLHVNIYSRIDYSSLFDITGQYIDSYGKLRAIQCVIDGHGISMIVIPSQPYNLPSMKRLKRISYGVAISLLGSPSSAFIEDDKIKGLWFKTNDIDNAIFIPIKYIDNSNKDIPPGPVPDLISSKYIDIECSGSIERLQYLKRTVKILKEIMFYIYRKYQLLHNKGYIEFSDKYIHIGDNKEYNIDNVQYKLPTSSSMKGLLRKLSEMVPDFVDNKGIRAINEEFRLKLISVLRSYYLQTHGSIINDSPYISGYFSFLSSFKEESRVYIFLNETEFTNWFAYQKYNEYGIYKLKTKIDKKMLHFSEPFLFRNVDSRYYLIQNISGVENVNDVLYTCYIWDRKRVNIGRGSTSRDMKKKGYIVYDIDEFGQLIPVKDKRTNDESYYRILNHNGMYSAILSI
jgi:hypothetical protein